MAIPKDCLIPMLDFADRYLRKDGVLAMAGLMGPFLLTRLIGSRPSIVDLGKLGERYGIRKLRLGRNPDCDLTFRDSNVSGDHARVVFENGNWCIVDGGSTNGTFAESRLRPNVNRPLQEDVIYSLAQVVEVEFMSTFKFRLEFEQRVRNRNETRRLSSRRYAKLRHTTKRKAPILTGKSLDLLNFANRSKQLSDAEFRRNFPNPVIVLLALSPIQNLEDDTDTIATSLVIDGSRTANLRFWPLVSRDQNPDIVFGRDPSSDLILPHHTISRSHATFEADEFLDEWVLADTESKNGVFIDGEPISQGQRLEDESCIRFGGEVLIQFFMPAKFRNFIRLYAASNSQ